MKIKSFECPKSIRNYEKKILGTSEAWLTSHLYHQPSKPAYYIVDCRISNCKLELQVQNPKDQKNITFKQSKAQINNLDQ